MAALATLRAFAGEFILDAVLPRAGWACELNRHDEGPHYEVASFHRALPSSPVSVPLS